MKTKSLFALVMLLCGTISTHPAAGGPLYDGSPGAPWWEFDYRTPGGITLIVDGDTTVWSLGGLFTKRRVIVKDRTSGERRRIDYPSAFCTPHSLVDLHYARAVVHVEMPDERGLLYINGSSPRRGASHTLASPILEPGKPLALHLRAAFRSGNQLLIEERSLKVHAGQKLAVAFDGTGAVRVPYPAAPTETAPPPRTIPTAAE